MTSAATSVAGDRSSSATMRFTACRSTSRTVASFDRSTISRSASAARAAAVGTMARLGGPGSAAAAPRMHAKPQATIAASHARR